MSGGPQGWQGPYGGQGAPGGGWQAPQNAPGAPGGWQGQPGGPGGWPGGPGGPGWQPPKKSLWSNPAFLVPVILALVVLVGGGIFLLTRSGDEVVVTAGTPAAATGAEDMAGLAEAMADADPADAPEAMPEAMVESMVEAMTDPEPEAAQTEAVRPQPLGAMPDAPPEPPPFDVTATPVPEQMTGSGDDLSAIRAAAQPVTPFQTVEIPIGGEDAAVISFTLQAGDTISVSAAGDQDPDVFIFGPDDAPVASDFDSGPGLDALASAVAEVPGEYLAAAVNNTGQAGTISMVLQDFAEFQVLDVPDGALVDGDFAVYPVEAVAGEVIHVLVASDFVPTIGIGVNDQIVAVGAEVASGLHLVEWVVQTDGVHDVLVLAEQAGGSFFLYGTIQIG